MIETQILVPDLEIINLLRGAVAGMLAGLLMGLVSGICYRRKIFESDLLLVDGSFFTHSLGIRASNALTYVAGILIHIVTSGFFGTVYIFITAQLKLNALSVGTVAIYFFILWIAMLFTALPIAGQGIMGNKAGSWTWLEQAVLHVIFGIGYFAALRVLF